VLNDGNGRMGILPTNLLLLQNGYLFTKISSHKKIIEKRKFDYYKALNDTQRSLKKDYENIYPWLKFFLEVVGEQKQRGNFYDLISPAMIKAVIQEFNAKLFKTTNNP